MSVRFFCFLFAKQHTPTPSPHTHTHTPAALCSSCRRSPPSPRGLPAARLASPGDVPGCRGCSPAGGGRLGEGGSRAPLLQRRGREAGAALGAELLSAAFGEAVPTSAA